MYGNVTHLQIKKDSTYQLG